MWQCRPQYGSAVAKLLGISNMAVPAPIGSAAAKLLAAAMVVGTLVERANPSSGSLRQAAIPSVFCLAIMVVLCLLACGVL